MTALPTLLTGAGAHARIRSVLEGVELRQLGVRPDVAPHSIYEELWHMVFWQDLILHWIDGGSREVPEHAAESWPERSAPEDVDEARRLVRTLLEGVNRAVDLASRAEGLDRSVRGTKTVRTLLESLLAHNAYHAGRIVLLRQLIGIWPPPSGGDTW
jgi:uncharacterized damage-inducible protein DinB